MKARPFVCDDFQKNVLEIFSDSAGKKSALFDFGEPYAFWKENYKLIQWMQDKGFCMLVRATDKFNDYIEELDIKNQNLFIIFIQLFLIYFKCKKLVKNSNI